MFGKSKEVIAARRDLKRRFIQMVLECARLGPQGLSGNRTLNASQTGNVTIAAGSFYNGLSDVEKTTLRTAKGCNKPPKDVKQKGYLTLADFIKIPTLNVQGAGCMAAFVSDLRLWGKQVIEKNPNTFAPQYKMTFDEGIAEAIKEGTVPIQEYKKNPMQYGEPTDNDQAFYWILLKFAMAVTNQPDRDTDDIKVVKSPDVKKLVKAELDNLLRETPKEFLDSPNNRLLLNNYDKLVDLSHTNYGAFLLWDLKRK